ncbi:MAG: carboxypeptidase regulatory-like domain-containing protein [Bryobacterales bacterium]|nr:carboxypeptidase regulatory-like domain-containing protein [Bryobacterales bacterium]
MRRTTLLVALAGWITALAQGPVRGQMGGRGQVAAPDQTLVRQAAPVDPKKLCRIEGRTVNARTGEPVPRVSLSLLGAGQQGSGRSGRSDNDGRFLIENIPPGTYRLMGDRVGFLREGYGSRTPGGTGAPLNLSEGQHLKDVEFRLTPQGVIMGQVFDEEGDPLPRSSVAAYPVGAAAAVQGGAPGGMRGGGQAGQIAGSSAMSNDIGEYRIPGLTPGRYLVVATSLNIGPGRGMGGRGGDLSTQSAGEDQAPLPTYYPAATDSAAAIPVEIAPGQDVAGINITVRRGALHRIQGRAVGNPQDLPSVRLSLMPRGAGVPFMAGRGGAQAGQDGSFEIARVQPGSYFILAQRLGGRGGPGGGGIVGKTLVDVTTSDITGLLVPILDPIAVSGAVKLEGQTTAGLQRLMLGLTSADGLPVGTPAGRVEDTGAFKIDGVFPDRYYLSVSGLPEGSYIKSMKLANQEVIDKGLDLSSARTGIVLDVLLSTKGATLEGVVTLDDKPATGSYVAVLADPIRPERPFLNKFATADQDGRFTIRGLAPGDYKVYAFAGQQPELSRDPGLARPYERSAVKIAVEEGATERAELKAIKPEDAR